MTIAFDAASNSGYEASLSTYGWSHTVGASGNGLVVGVAIFIAGSVTSITYGGIALTKIRSDAGAVYRSELWYLQNPLTGANTVTVTLNASLTSIAGAISYSNCGGPAANAGTTGTNNPAAQAVTPIQNSAMVVACLAVQTASGTSDAAAQTNRVAAAGALGTQRMSEKSGSNPAVATTLTYNGIGAIDAWAISVVALLDLEHLRLPIYKV